MGEVIEIQGGSIAGEAGAKHLYVSDAGMHFSCDFEGRALPLNLGAVTIVVAVSQVRRRDAERTVIDVPGLDRAAALLRQYGISYMLRPCETRQCIELRAADGALLVLTHFG